MLTLACLAFLPRWPGPGAAVAACSVEGSAAGCSCSRGACTQKKEVCLEVDLNYGHKDYQTLASTCTLQVLHLKQERSLPAV